MIFGGVFMGRKWRIEVTCRGCYKTSERSKNKAKI